MKQELVMSRMRVLKSSAREKDKTLVDQCILNAKKYIDYITESRNTICMRNALGKTPEKGEIKKFIKDRNKLLYEVKFSLYEINVFCNIYDVPRVFKDRVSMIKKSEKSRKELDKIIGDIYDEFTYQDMIKYIDCVDIVESDIIDLCKDII